VKKLSSILFSVLILLNAAGYYKLFRCGFAGTNLSQNSPAEKCISVVSIPDGYSSLAWQNEHSFFYNGYLFDIGKRQNAQLNKNICKRSHRIKRLLNKSEKGHCENKSYIADQKNHWAKSLRSFSHICLKQKISKSRLHPYALIKDSIIPQPKHA
jgi:hypothetical protein